MEVSKRESVERRVKLYSFFSLNAEDYAGPLASLFAEMLDLSQHMPSSRDAFVSVRVCCYIGV